MKAKDPNGMLTDLLPDLDTDRVLDELVADLDTDNFDWDDFLPAWEVPFEGCSPEQSEGLGDLSTGC